jgi:hypothetical protein
VTPESNQRKLAFERMQDAFVKAWHEQSPTLSKSERARRAAIAAGYSEATARSAGLKLIAKPRIMERLLLEHPRALARKSGIDAVWGLTRPDELRLKAVMDDKLVLASVLRRHW